MPIGNTFPIYSRLRTTAQIPDTPKPEKKKINQFQSAFTREGDSDLPSKGASPFSPMGDITVDPKGVAKLLDRLNVHKAPGPDGLNARVLLIKSVAMRSLQYWHLS